MHEGERLKLVALQPHHGKSAALNEAIRACSGQLVVFSDVDAILERSALRKLLRHFADPTIGGVCGLRVIAEGGRLIGGPQRTYVGFDSTIKMLESRLGSIASNDGKLYAIRKDLFQPIDRAAMDDLWVCLTVIRQHFRFIFEPEAVAYIKLPARSPQHEVSRRRRMTQLSLRCLLLTRAVFNPFQYGALSLRLGINKVVRRMLPLAMLVLLASSLALVYYDRIFLVILLPQLLLYGAAATRLFVSGRDGGSSLLGRVAWAAYYFCLGNLGVLLGLMDFARGRRSIGWDPKKVD
jgi:cellulose synthase/poly-beta-1,6-N-acetylglucosamine synthase-like glycosyltransferase